MLCTLANNLFYELLETTANLLQDLIEQRAAAHEAQLPLCPLRHLYLLHPTGR